MKKVELLIKPVSYDCNLNCKYCFYKKTSSIYPEKRHLMRDDVLEKLISESMQYSTGVPCIFSWQGGEPLLAEVDFFRKVIELQKKYGRSGQRVSNSVQTNGTLLSGEWIKLFREFNFFIGISLDGPSEVHNHYRSYCSGNGSFQKVMQGIGLLKRGNVEFNVLSTLGRETVKDPRRIYNFFLSEELYYLQFIPAVDRKDKKLSDFSVTPQQYGDFLCGLFDVWWNKGNPFTSIRLFDKAKSQFGKLKKIVPLNCQKCQWNFICHNGCLWFRWVKNGNIREKDYLCAPYRVEEPFFSMYDRKRVPSPIRADFSGKRVFMKLLHKAHGMDKLNEDNKREIRATYYGMVSKVDNLWE